MVVAVLDSTSMEAGKINATCNDSERKLSHACIPLVHPRQKLDPSYVLWLVHLKCHGLD
jgi:hypothetical protein